MYDWCKNFLNTGVDSLSMIRYVASGRGFMSSNEPVRRTLDSVISVMLKRSQFIGLREETSFVNVPSGFIYTINEPENNFNKRIKKV